MIISTVRSVRVYRGIQGVHLEGSRGVCDLHSLQSVRLGASWRLPWYLHGFESKVTQVSRRFGRTQVGRRSEDSTSMAFTMLMASLRMSLLWASPVP